MDMSALIGTLRSFVPLGPRRFVASLKRWQRDKTANINFATQRRVDPCTDWSVLADVTQPLILAPYLDQKRANLAKAIVIMNDIEIRPGQTLSIWKCLGPPIAGRGWAAGRTIINDVVTTDPGGGLCQFSSLIYHLGLLAGLTVIERHNHSRDIHVSDATRFTELGLDATIVYGFKDLRLSNCGQHNVVFGFELTSNAISGRILGPVPRVPNGLQTRRDNVSEGRKVEVWSQPNGGVKRMVSQDFYTI